jgi:hypothetical protein
MTTDGDHLFTQPLGVLGGRTDCGQRHFRTDRQADAADQDDQRYADGDSCRIVLRFCTIVLALCLAQLYNESWNKAQAKKDITYSA